MLLTCFVVAGCSETKNEKETAKLLDPKKITQEELNKLTEEEVDKLNDPPNGKPIEINKAVDVAGYHIEVHHYYKLEGIYDKYDNGRVSVLKPLDEGDEYVVYYVKVTNNTKEEKLAPIDFHIITSNGEKKLGSILSSIKNPYLNGSTIMPGGYKEGYVVGLAPKRDNNLTLLISENLPPFSEEEPDTAEIPLPPLPKE